MGAQGTVVNGNNIWEWHPGSWNEVVIQLKCVVGWKQKKKGATITAMQQAELVAVNVKNQARFGEFQPKPGPERKLLQQHWGTSTEAITEIPIWLTWEQLACGTVKINTDGSLRDMRAIVALYRYDLGSAITAS